MQMLLRLLPCSPASLSSRLHCRCTDSGISVMRLISERPNPFLELRFFWSSSYVIHEKTKGKDTSKGISVDKEKPDFCSVYLGDEQQAQCDGDGEVGVGEEQQQHPVRVELRSQSEPVGYKSGETQMSKR
ncbi:hypothetical protein EYF80_032619 [Liparis tanakae]|uniref:Uncharacterized protein n=1 Tax=Liparis tanakae TaxID=230148 RepID=A0A4Z2GUS3_9TELE|nr:hypothetical protein EYF80_032619 [Liparis tanakae]